MGIVDGRSYTWRGLSGMYAIDGGLSLAACALMAFLMIRASRLSAEDATAA
jgi:hypothetical protein